MADLKLPTVTLCAAASVNVRATVAALIASLDQAEFAECLFFTDQDVERADERIRVVPIGRLGSSKAYSEFVLRELSGYIKSEHCLVVQWDGFVLDGAQWDPAFLHFDYIGASWPQFRDGHDVGNGGFSLRSRRLLEACLDPRFKVSHPEDVAICRLNRQLLEREGGIRFANQTAADRFAFERAAPSGPTFGFHGIFNMIPVLGRERFWEIYRTLDDRETALADYNELLRQLGSGRKGMRRRLQLSLDVVRRKVGL